MSHPLLIVAGVNHVDRIWLGADQEVDELSDVVVVFCVRLIETCHPMPAISALSINGLVCRDRIEPWSQSATEDFPDELFE